jgi:23S rRNA (uracil1939-C5)-methyltransferase
MLGGYSGRKFRGHGRSHSAGAREVQEAGAARSGRGTRQRREPSVPPVGQQVTAEIGPLTLDGEAVVRYGQYVLFVSGAIPGEKAVIEVVSTGPRYGRARLIRVVHPSPERVEPRCRHFGICGGCSWQHMAYTEQLRWKERLLESTLEHAVGDRHLLIRPIIGMEDPWGTRNKVHFLIGTSQGQVALGHFRAHSRQFIPVVECPVHAPAGNRVARGVLRVLDQNNVPACGEGTDGIARHLQVRVADSDASTQVTLVATRSKFPGLASLGPDISNSDQSISGVHLNINGQRGSVVFGRETRRLAGSDRMVEEIAGVRFLISATSFFQTNSKGAARLAETVLKYVPAMAPGPILDLYAGVGLFSALLCKRGHSVIAVEENPLAVRDGIETLKQNRITDCRYISGKVETALKKLVRQEHFQVVILDPPREGCPEWALRMLARKLRPERIIDVSCDPRSLARDLALLTQAGYRVVEIQPIDMFPHTSHIESVALLIRSH